MRTPLAAWHAAQGAVLVDDRGVELPERFTDPVEEYRAVREKAGLIDLCFRTQVRMSGEDRVSFLQGMVSNDVKALKPGAGCPATLLTEQGRIVADLRVYALDTCFLLDLDARIKEKVIETLSGFIIADDVEMEDESATHTTIALQGPLSSQVLSAAGVTVSLEKAFQHTEAMIADACVRVIRVSDTGEEGYDIIVANSHVETVWRTILEAGAAVGIRPVGLTALNMLRVEAGIPWYGVDMDESRIVLEVGFEQAISFKKGCYLGQEVVERATARGHVNRKLIGLVIHSEDLPARADKLLYDGREVGWLTSVAYSPRLGKPIALGYVRREHMTPGVQLQIDRQGTPMIAEMTTLPFPQ
jgi:glycine cleavage system T protein